MIRLARYADLATIIAIYNHSIPAQKATADTEAIHWHNRVGWFYDHDPNTHPLWVIERQEQVVGWLGWGPFYGRPAYRATAELSIYIAPAWQGQGLGKSLLQTAIAASPSLGLKTLLGFIFAHNQPSIGLFESLGFQQWGTLPRVAQLGAQERDLLILGKRI
jgi:phosphinothricin acetyltransferase